MKAKPTNAERKARARAPAPVILQLRQDLKPNDRHPLCGIDPERRNADRVQLIAAVLARLANGPSAEEDKAGTMTQSDVAESNNGEQPTETR